MASIRRGFSPMSSRKRSFPRVSISQGVPREAHTRVRLPPHRTPSARPGTRGTGTAPSGRGSTPVSPPKRARRSPPMEKGSTGSQYSVEGMMVW